MATGKTHARHVRVKVDDVGGTLRDISASVDNIGGVGLTYSEEEVTTFADRVMQYLTGYGDSDISMSGPFNNDPAAAIPSYTGAHTVLSAIAGHDVTSKTLTIELGVRADPTTGDPKWSGEYVCTEYSVAADGAARWSAKFRPALGAAAPAWGTV